MPLVPDLEAWLRLSLLDGLGPQALPKLLVARGSPRDILASGARDLATVVPGKLVSAIRDGGASDEALDKVDKWLADPTNHVITLADSEYPRALLEIADPPPLLYVKGRLDLLNRPGFAIVGSRKISGVMRFKASIC